MGHVEEENGVADYTQDGTVDLKGNPVRRSRRGGWTACSFIVGGVGFYAGWVLDGWIAGFSGFPPVFMNKWLYVAVWLTFLWRLTVPASRFLCDDIRDRSNELVPDPVDPI